MVARPVARFLAARQILNWALLERKALEGNWPEIAELVHNAANDNRICYARYAIKIMSNKRCLLADRQEGIFWLAVQTVHRISRESSRRESFAEI